MRERATEREEEGGGREGGRGEEKGEAETGQKKKRLTFFLRR